MFIVQTGENWTQEQLNVFLWDISQLQRDISVIIHYPNFFVSTDVTFNESQSYFFAPYLQDENSIKEDKDQDSYLIDLFLVYPPKVVGLVSIPSISEPELSSLVDLISEPELSSFVDPILELELSFVDPSPEPVSSPIHPTPENRMTGKVYLRKKAIVPRLIQVQEFEPASRNEITVSHPPLPTESKFPISIRKGTKECTKLPLYDVSTFPCYIIQKVVSIL